MPFCSNCGTELVEDAKYCPSCGVPVYPLVAEADRRTQSKTKRKKISTLSLVLIIVVPVAILLLLSSMFFLGSWFPFGVVGSGNLVTEEMLFTGFTSVDAGNGFRVEITKSNSYNLMVTADDNVMEYIEITQSGNTLIIGLKGGYSFWSTTMKAEIAMPELYSLTLSGGAQGKLEDYNSIYPFSLELSGGSTLRGEFETPENVDFSLSGGSRLLGFVGAAKNLSLGASGGSQVEISDFFVHNADVHLSGGSRATINLDGILDANLSGGSNLSYFGDATLGKIQTTSGSEITKK
ncbi:MAG: DUF2807 domain-containing protein [Candidatus Bathyarchaeota archaeon]|nr:DUF2807 domain-containing protein [Candidatus Bathyarchaeum tardum]